LSNRKLEIAFLNKKKSNDKTSGNKILPSAQVSTAILEPLERNIKLAANIIVRDHFSHGEKNPPPLLGKSAAGITPGPMGGVRERPYITFYASAHTYI
jgi:hypothetical protein